MSHAELGTMEKTYEDYRLLVPIDKHQLDHELETQAVKYRDVTEALALVISYAAGAKDDFDQIEAELIRITRDNYERDHAGEEKVPRLTDTAVMAIVKQDPAWIGAKAIRRDWENMQTKFSFLKETFAQRSSNMKELPVLYASGYWQTNSSTGQPRSRIERTHDLQAQAITRDYERRGMAGGVGTGVGTERRRPRERD